MTERVRLNTPESIWRPALKEAVGKPSDHVTARDLRRRKQQLRSTGQPIDHLRVVVPGAPVRMR